MERSNEASLNRQRQRRQRNEYSENLVDPLTRQNVDDRVDYLNELQSSGRIDNTRDARAVRTEIERLEEYQQQRTEQFEQAQEEDRQRGGAGQDASAGLGGTLPTFEERERDAGLNLAGNDPMSGRGQDDPTMDEREAAAGLRGTTTGRDFSEQQERQTIGDDTDTPSPDEQPGDALGTFGVILCINGRPHSASIYGQIGGKL